jgi:hypothetical protein
MLAVNPKLLANFFYVELGSEQPQLWKCRKCQCNKRKSGGWTNLTNHTKSCVGSNYKEIFNEKNSSGAFATFLPTVSKKEKEMFGWIQFIVLGNHSLAVVDNEITRDVVRFEKITSKLLRKTILSLKEEVKRDLRKMLPDKFVLVFDGWSEGTDHYIAVNASYIVPGTNRATETLLAIRPLLAAGVITMSADDHAAHLKQVLTDYGKTIANVVCIAGDNCSVNKSLARKLGVPLLGCGSHKFNLAVKKWVADNPALSAIVARLSLLMKKASTLKNSAELRNYTDLIVVKENATRWSSTFNMIQRFIAIKPHLEKLESLAEFMLSCVEVNTLLSSFTHLKKFNEVTVALQKEGVTVLEVREIFDFVLEDYPELGFYLSETAEIIQDKLFERAIMKIHKEVPLNANEMLIVAKLKKLQDGGGTAAFESMADGGSEGNINYALDIQQRIKRRRVGGSVRDEYINMDMLVGTSVSCERIFSIAQHIMTAVRKSTSPIVFEAILFLKMNRDNWDENVVGRAMGSSALPSETTDDAFIM